MKVHHRCRQRVSSSYDERRAFRSLHSEDEPFERDRISRDHIKASPKFSSSSRFSKGFTFHYSNKESCALRRRNTLTAAELPNLARALAGGITKQDPKSPTSSQFSRNFQRRHSMGRTACTISALTSSLDQQPKAINGVPILVEACLRYLSTNAIDCVGLFRVPGESDHVNQLWEYMKYHPFARLSMNCIDVFMRNHTEFTAHDVASFVKRAIKSMVGNEHVVTSNCYDPLVSLIRSNCPAHQLGEKCRRIIGQLLVPARRLLLGRLCNFLREFSQHHSITQMNCDSLAVCFANLMQPPARNEGDASTHAIVGTVNSRKRFSMHSFPIGFRKKKIKEPMNADQLRVFIVDEGRKSKLCVAVIKVLIDNSEYIFSNQRASAHVKKSGTTIFM